MKKFLSVLLALVMVFALSTVAFAEGSSESVSSLDDENTATFDVTGPVEIVKSNKVAAVTYCVTITWTVDETPTPRFNVNDYWMWDPATLKYVNYTDNDSVSAAEGGALDYSEDGYTIDVKVEIENRSNAAVKYTLSYSNAGASSIFEELTDTTATADKTGTLISADTVVQAPVHSDTDFGPGKIDGTNYNLAGKNNLDQAGTEQKETINATLHFSDLYISGFKELLTSESTLSYGTYTVTISEPTAG